jgi:copper chaperone CopZ
MLFNPFKTVVVFSFFLFVFSEASFAQFTSAVLGVDGLTCSACSYGTERSIRKLYFVQDVKMELNKNTATITFKKDKDVSIDALVKKVYDAGFSVRFVEAVYHFDQPVTISNNLLKEQATTFYVLKTNTLSLSGDVTMHFISEKYIPKKELVQWKNTLTTAHEQLKSLATPVYFVSIP